MAVRYIGSTSAAPQVLGSSVVGAAVGGTLAGGQVIQVVYDDTYFGATPEGKQRLVAALDFLGDRIDAAKSWPIDATS